ncbi:MAG: hypothetical protein PSV35_08960 [bacterium]|nr:hypothetical protein [bacterium]
MNVNLSPTNNLCSKWKIAFFFEDLVIEHWKNPLQTNNSLLQPLM